MPSNKPTFQHPALDVGVAKYPTPNVPDYYTKSGHIVLVIKESIEKGSYNPKPLDGSITYTGRDANKWPTPLYLVHQSPTEDGEYVYNTYANDRTLASQDPWNYGLDYSGNNPSYPITSRTYIVPRDEYEAVILGSVDPVFGGAQIISQQKMVELADDNPLRSRYVMVQRTYESIPGPIITGQRLDARGDIETVEVQTVLANTPADADDLFVTETKVDPVDSVKSTKTKATVESYVTLTTTSNKPGLQGETSTTDDIVNPATTPDPLSIDVLDSSVEQLTATKARKRTTTSTGPTVLSGTSRKDGLLGETTISEYIVGPNTQADTLSQTVVQSEVTPIDSYKSKKTTITSTGPASLSGSARKAGLLGSTTETQSIVDPNATPDSLSTTVVQSEIIPIDSGKSKKVTITSIGPSSLSGNSFKGGLMESFEKIESIVGYGASPDALSQSSLGGSILESSVDPIDLGKSKKTTIKVNSFPALKSEKIDPLTNTKTTTFTEQIVDAGSATATVGGGIVTEFEGIDSVRAKQTTSNYSSLIGYTWTEYETISYSFPGLLKFSGPGPVSADNILGYIPARSFRVLAEVKYIIEAEAYFATLPDAPVNFVTRTLVTDFGTFPNVLHNAATVLLNGVDVVVEESRVYVTSPVAPIDNIIKSLISPQIYFTNYKTNFSSTGSWYQPKLKVPVDVSATRIKGMGGLCLYKTTWVNLV